MQLHKFFLLRKKKKKLKLRVSREEENNNNYNYEMYAVCGRKDKVKKFMVVIRLVISIGHIFRGKRDL